MKHKEWETTIINQFNVNKTIRRQVALGVVFSDTFANYDFALTSLNWPESWLNISIQFLAVK